MPWQGKGLGDRYTKRQDGNKTNARTEKLFTTPFGEKKVQRKRVPRQTPFHPLSAPGRARDGTH